jgi:hypothetical protein
MQTNRRGLPNKVTVAFSGFGCEGECPFQAVSIDSTLQLKYYGGQFAPRKGYYTDEITADTWRYIQSHFEKFISHGMDTTQYEKTDHPMVELIIYSNDKKYYFRENTGKISNNDLTILHWFITLATQTSDLKQSDSLFFETSIQNINYIEKRSGNR